MNKIVVEHYPVEKLPEDLREGFGRGDSVRVTVEAEAASPRPLSHTEFIAQLDAIGRNPDRPTVTREEAVRRIRDLRDEWDDE